MWKGMAKVPQLWAHQSKIVDEIAQPIDQQRVQVLSGVVDVGCGGGKTVIGCELICRVRARSMVVSIHRTSLEQWQSHLSALGIESCLVSGHNRTDWATDDRPVVLCVTYAALTRGGNVHNLFASDTVQLMLLDEVHCASAEVFRGACQMCVKAVVGFTGTLVREDDGVAQLLKTLGPVRYRVSGGELASKGITAKCQNTVHVLPRAAASSADESKFKYCARLLNDELPNEHVLLYLDRLATIAPLKVFLRECTNHVVMGPITGKTSTLERSDIIHEFDVCPHACVLILTKVGNAALDFASANAVIQLQQVSSSRNEEGQRMGRIVRSKPGCVVQMHTLATEGTSEVSFARRRAEYQQSVSGVETVWVDAIL